jgi:hypothetical protein
MQPVFQAFQVAPTWPLRPESIFESDRTDLRASGASTIALVPPPWRCPTLGLLLRKSKNKVVAEYALRVSPRPLEVAEYQLVAALPDPLQTNLPTIEQIERELQED